MLRFPERVRRQDSDCLQGMIGCLPALLKLCVYPGEPVQALDHTAEAA